MSRSPLWAISGHITTARCHVRFTPKSGHMGALAPCPAMVPLADIVLSPGSTYSFDVFDGYQFFRGSTLLLF